MDIRKLQRAIVDGLEDVKAQDIVVFNTEHLTSMFERVIVAQQGAGPVYLSQVADVIDGEKEETSYARINGRPAITLDLLKAQDANIVDTGRAIVQAVATLKARLDQAEAAILREAMHQHRGNKTRVAADLGLTRVGLRMKLERLGLA